jgi:hypothetical protein
MSGYNITPSRRQVLATTALAASAASMSSTLASVSSDSVKQDLERYIGFGIKASGGPGDIACGEWLESELRKQGFVVQRQTISVPFFTPGRADLTSGSQTAPVIPQAIVVPTGDAGVTGRFVRVSPLLPIEESLSDAIALIDVPAARRSSALEKPFQIGVKAAIAKGARAAIIIPNGPTHEAVALNADGNKPMFDVPVAVLAPRDAVPFLAAAEQNGSGTLFVTGAGGRRDAFNLAGHLDRGKSKWIVVSTPRSGWFTCAGERGPGIAVWLALARWAPKALEAYNLAFVCNTAHEYEYLGAEQALQAIAPKPDETAMWLALGAAIAARDWHALIPPFLPLPSADSQRFLVVSSDILDAARRAFAGQPGIEAAYDVSRFTAGELTPVYEAGYKTVAGFFGIHRFHHTQSDDERCIVVEPTRQAVAGCQTLLQALAHKGAR